MKYELRIMNIEISKTTLTTLVLILASCFLFLSSTPSAFAQEFYVSINPPIIQIEAELPARISTPITIENKSDQNITYSIFLRPFKAGSELNGTPNYDPQLNNKYEDFFENVQIRDGNKDITQITLSPKQAKELSLEILLKSDEPPIDRYFTVVFLDEPKASESETSFTGNRGGIGTNILLSIGSKPEAEGRIAEFKTSLFINRGPVPFELELANHSDFYVASEGTIVIKNMFGQIVGALEFGPLNILAKSNRLVSDSNESETKLWWSEKYPVGFYKAQVNVALSERGPLLTDELIFIAFPIQLAFMIILAILIFAWLLKRARKKANEVD